VLVYKVHLSAVAVYLLHTAAAVNAVIPHVPYIAHKNLAYYCATAALLKSDGGVKVHVCVARASDRSLRSRRSDQSCCWCEVCVHCVVASACGVAVLSSLVGWVAA
jgi:hypothetical protein